MRPHRRHAHSACDANASCDSLVVTHPFHPLRGRRLAILFERRTPEGRLYVCEGPVASIGILEDATDRGPEPAEQPLSLEVLVELVAVAAAVGDVAGREDGR